MDDSATETDEVTIRANGASGRRKQRNPTYEVFQRGHMVWSGDALKRGQKSLEKGLVESGLALPKDCANLVRMVLVAVVDGDVVTLVASGVKASAGDEARDEAAKRLNEEDSYGEFATVLSSAVRWTTRVDPYAERVEAIVAGVADLPGIDLDEVRVRARDALKRTDQG